MKPIIECQDCGSKNIFKNEDSQFECNQCGTKWKVVFVPTKDYDRNMWNSIKGMPSQKEMEKKF